MVGNQNNATITSGKLRVSTPPEVDREFPKTEVPTLGYRHITDQTAKNSGLWGTKIEVFPAGIRMSRLPTVEEIEEGFSRRDLEHICGKRKECKGFRSYSRKRLVETIHTVGREDPPMMLTLTYRSEVNWETSKYQLSKYLQWLKRHYEAGSIWRLEVQIRGVLHYHVLVWGDCAGMRDDASYNAMGDRLSHKWAALTGQGMDEDRLREGCHIRMLDNSPQSRFYLVGHSSKSNQIAYGKGRQWGVYNRNALEIGKAKNSYLLTEEQAIQFKRICSRLAHKRSSGGRRYDLNKLKTSTASLSGSTLRKAIDWIRSES